MEAASFRRSLRQRLAQLLEIGGIGGNRPQNTTGTDGLKPGSAAAAGCGPR
jgi:hypothetical protein